MEAQQQWELWSIPNNSPAEAPSPSRSLTLLWRHLKRKREDQACMHCFTKAVYEPETFRLPHTNSGIPSLPVL